MIPYRYSRASQLALVLALFAATPTTGQAQLLEQDDAGYPLRLITRSLAAGTTYYFQTTNLQNVAGGSVADTVLTLVSPSGVAVAGADVCGGSVYASCFSYTVPAGAGGNYVLHLRAYRRTTPGRATVQYRPSTTSTWTTLLTDVTFGGGSASMPLTASTPFHVHTRLLPGAIVGGTPSTNTLHGIWVTDATEWRIVQRHYYDGRVGDTAVVEGTDPVSAGLSASSFWRAVYGSVWTPGPIAIFRNDPTSGADWDGDGLALALESHGSVDACDRPGQSSPSPAFSCNRGERCATCVATGNAGACSLCRADLRDTDNDGIHDYVEWYGYDQPDLHITKWGAQPGHMDVFVEVDALDRSADPATCVGFEPALDVNLNLGSRIDVPFIDRVVDVYGDAPARLNPDGTAGIRLHFDVGLTNPDPADTRWGAWGGGNTCIPQYDPSGGAGTSTCLGYWQPYQNTCSVVGMTLGRGWVFRYLLDNVGNEAGQAFGNAAGVTGVSTWAHELGHVIGLGHGGPVFSTAGSGNADVNFRSTHASRMNYRFEDAGSPDGSLGPQWTLFSFSAGLMNGAAGNGYDLLAMPELCPEGPGASELLLLGENIGGWLNEVRTSGSCVDVNWDWSRDALGAPTYGGVSYDATYGSFRRWHRRTAVHTTELTPIPSAPDAAVANGLLLVASLVPAAGGFRVRLNADGADADCNTFPYGLRSPEFVGYDARYEFWGSYPGCFRHGTTYTGATVTTARGVAIESAVLPGGAEGAVVVTNAGTELYWSRYQVGPSSTNSTEMTITPLTVDAVVPRGTAAAPGTGTMRHEPALVRVPGSEELLLVYGTTSSNDLLQLSLPAGSSTWSAVGAARLTDAAGGAALTTGRSPSLAVVAGEVYLATTRPSDDAMRVYRLDAAGSPASARRWTLVGTTAASARRPTIAAARSLASPTQWDVVLVSVAPTGRLQYHRAPVAASLNFASEPWSQVGEEAQVDGVAAVWDERPGSPFPDLRVYRTRPAGCDTSCPGSCSLVLAQSMCVDAAGRTYAWIELDPFARGPAPGTFADYDEWTMVGWGVCENLRHLADPWRSAPPGFQNTYCGEAPIFPEPSSSGMSLSAPPGPNDRLDYPYLYEDERSYSCGP